MLGYMVNLFVSGFVYHGILWNQALIGIGLGIAFGAIWYAAYWTPILKNPGPGLFLPAAPFLSGP